MSAVRPFWKDILREIARNKARFTSLVFITALGAMVIVGLQAAAINMQNAANRKYTEHSLYDLHLRSTTGFTENDIAAIRNTYGVAEVMGSYIIDVYVSVGGERRPVRTFSMPDRLNFLTLKEGRFPRNYSEIVVERRLFEHGGYVIGDRITLSLTDMARFENIFATNEFTIVGVVSSPLFLTFQRGHTTLGNGVISYYVYLHQSAYLLEVFTDVYIEMKGSREIFNLSREYDDLAEEWRAMLTLTGDAQIEAFHAGIYEAIGRLEGIETQMEEIMMIITQLNEAIARASDSPEDMDAFALETKAAWEARYAGFAQFYARTRALEFIPAPEWHYFTRKDGIAFDAYYQDTLRLKQIGYVFPVVFLLVAILVSLTSMSRMVEEHRAQIGTYKALGFGSFSVIFKYGLYAAVSGILGGIIGVGIGSQVFPRIIADAYSNLYSMPPIETPIPWAISAIAILVSVLSVLITTIITCVKTISGAPAELLRPKAPKPGKRVLLERVPFVWNRLGFIEKVTSRNIFRYKRRFLMTLTGIIGCTALIVTAFAMRDSLGRIADLQYTEILLYDTIIHVEEITDPGQRLTLNETIPAQYRLYSRQETTTVQTDLGQIAASIIVPECTDSVPYFIRLTALDGTPVQIPGSGAVLTEKLARDLGLSVGDTAGLRMGTGETFWIYVYNIVENYVVHYVYMSPEYYAEVFGAALYPNILLVRGEVDNRQILAIDGVRAVICMAEREQGVRDSTDALGIVTILILLASCTLSFIVLFNLTIINLAERRRELATVKVLGFQDRETSMYIGRENLAVTIIGIIIGLVAGYYLSNFVISSIEITMIKFPRDINATSFVYAAALSFAFAMFVNFVTHWKIVAIDMVESLKSIE